MGENMNYRENKDSAINRALNRLENAHQDKKQKSQNAKDAVSGAPQMLLSSAAMPLEQLENIFRNSQKTFGSVTRNFESKLKSEPWAMLGKVAIVSLVAGIMIGHQLRRSKAKVK
jgi:hypothetical protein